MDFEYVRGETHGSEYSWHKYWSRKPANLIASYLETLVPYGGRVLDPFAGSGVILRESMRLGLNCSAFDVNPVAVEISKFMTCSLDPGVFARNAEDLISAVESDLGSTYVAGGTEIRFIVHHMATLCSKCGEENVYSKTKHGGRLKRCVKCDATISFGLLGSTRTVITEVNFVDGSHSEDPDLLTSQTESSKHKSGNWDAYSARLVTNRRTLSSNKFRTSDFFTARNFSILAACADYAHNCEDEELCRALLLLITGSAAQASKLIASRGRLAGGGQAWTIPGFWVPPVHLESNPFIHLRARAKKMTQALHRINCDRRGTAKIRQVSALLGMRESAANSEKFDLIFLDPPYCDSVPFAEFSAIWNAFLKREIDYTEDISVSDRTESPSTMITYEKSLSDIATSLQGLLTASGKLLLTFNNHDLKAWAALVGALQKSGFSATFVRYHDPAVVSTKSQKALTGSYVGDFYVVFSANESKVSQFSDCAGEVRELLIRAAAIRGGSVSRALALRFGLQLWLELNIDASEIVLLDEVIQELFVDKQGVLSLIDLPDLKLKRLEDIVMECSEGKDLDSADQLTEFLKTLESRLRLMGLPSPSEAVAIVNRERQPAQLW